MGSGVGWDIEVSFTLHEEDNGYYRKTGPEELKRLLERDLNKYTVLLQEHSQEPKIIRGASVKLKRIYVREAE